MRYDDLSEDGFEDFGSADSGGGYDWSVFHVWLKDGVFYWASDSGCSCNGPWDYPYDFPGDFNGHGTRHEVVTALFDWAGGPGGAAKDGESLLIKLLNYRAADKASPYPPQSVSPAGLTRQEVK